jgi:cytochrome P450 family 307 subfamily A
VDRHRRTIDSSAEPRDFTDALLIHLREDPNLSWEHIIFELEDFLGGHSAIGNLTMLALAAVARNPEVGERIQKEVDAATGGLRNVNMFDKPVMPYTEATILETLRSSSSPIVPHVASQDTSIAGTY